MATIQDNIWTDTHLRTVVIEQTQGFRSRMEFKHRQMHFFHASLKTPTCRTNIVFDKHCFSVFQIRFILWWPCFLARSVSETVRKDLLQRFQRSSLYKKLQKDWPRERWTHYMPVGTPSKGGTQWALNWVATARKGWALHWAAVLRRDSVKKRKKSR